MKTFIILVILCAGAGRLVAAAAIPPTPIAVALENAKTTAKRGDAAGAEQHLLSANHAPAGTFDWQIESAQRLMRLAYSLPREGSMVAVPALIASMLQHLAVAENLAPDARRKAVAQALAGNVHENFRGDRAAAQASYRAAALLAPDDPNAARAADRLQRLDDHLRSRKQN